MNHGLDICLLTQIWIMPGSVLISSRHIAHAHRDPEMESVSVSFPGPRPSADSTSSSN